MLIDVMLSCICYTRDLHVLTHSVPTRRSSGLQSSLVGFSRDSAWAYPWPVEAKGGPLPTRRLRAPPVGGRYPFHQDTNRIKRRDCMNAATPVDTAKGCQVREDRFRPLLGRRN